jgi:hypothetical protein
MGWGLVARGDWLGVEISLHCKPNKWGWGVGRESNGRELNRGS